MINFSSWVPIDAPRGAAAPVTAIANTAAARTAITRRPTGVSVALLESRCGFPAGRRLRLGRGRFDRPARVPGDDAARGLRLPGRPRAAAVRAEAARRDPA